MCLTKRALGGGKRRKDSRPPVHLGTQTYDRVESAITSVEWPADSSRCGNSETSESIKSAEEV